MELGFASAIFPDLSLQQVVEFASSSGFSCVELMYGQEEKLRDVTLG